MKPFYVVLLQLLFSKYINFSNNLLIALKKLPFDKYFNSFGCISSGLRLIITWLKFRVEYFSFKDFFWC